MEKLKAELKRNVRDYAGIFVSNPNESSAERKDRLVRLINNITSLLGVKITVFTLFTAGKATYSYVENDNVFRQCADEPKNGSFPEIMTPEEFEKGIHNSNFIVVDIVA